LQLTALGLQCKTLDDLRRVTKHCTRLRSLYLMHWQCASPAGSKLDIVSSFPRIDVLSDFI
jgi:hypothetical protein